MATVEPLRTRTDDGRHRRPRRFALRRLSAPLRALPDFLIIGEMKCGTTSLYAHLQQHPQVQPPIRKELHFFSVGADKSLGWYRAHFPRRSSLGERGITGEACPDYLFTPGAESHISAVVPGARLVVLLRNPVDRAVSHYFHEVSMGRETLPIEQALDAEEDRLQAASQGGSDWLETYLHASYKRRGIYADSLQRYWQVFSPEQVLVLDSARLFGEPQRVCPQIFEFLGLPDQAGVPFPRKNAQKVSGEVPTGVRERLQTFFEPHNERLFELMGTRYDW